KHLYLPFVAGPLCLTAIHYLLYGRGAKSERYQRLLRVGSIAFAALLVGVSYHALNWRIVAEHILRLNDPARTGGIGLPPTLCRNLNSLIDNIFRETVVGLIVLIVGATALLLQGRYALLLLAVWIIGVTFAVPLASSYPLGYYFLSFYPAISLLATGWLARPLV